MKKGKKFTAALTAYAVVAALAVPAVASASTVTFSDTGSSYAQQAILDLANEGILNGVGNGQFNPTGKITRQDMAIVLAKALKLDVSTPPSTPTFSDVPASNYAFAYVEAAAKAGLIKGEGNGQFGYGQNLTREALAVMLVNALGVDATGAASSLNFSDNSSISYGKDAVGYAVKAGLLHGFPDGSFQPAGNATREQVALVVSKFMSLKADSFSIKASATNVAVGAPVQFSVASAADVQWSVSGSGAVIDQNGNFVATTAGSYTVTAVANGKTLTQTVTVFGAPATVTVTSSAATLSATTGTTTLTAKVVDANGTPVAGAVVDFYSSNTSILDVPATATTDATGVASVTATAGATDGTATVTTTVDGTAVTNTTDVTVSPVTAGQVTVLNADQIQIAYSEKVLTGGNSVTNAADNIANYSVTSVDSLGATTTYAGVGSGSAAVQADGKTVVITLGAPIKNGTTVAVQATNVDSADGLRTLPMYSSSVTVNDTTAPTISSITSSTNGVAGDTVTVSFSEPTTKAGTIKLDGVDVTGSGTWTDEQTFTITGQVLDPSKAHTIDAFGVTDLATPSNSTVNLAKSFNVTVDQAAPTVSSVTALNDHQVEVVFNKAVNVASVTTAGISVADETLSTVSSSVAYDSNDTTYDGTVATKYVVSLPATDDLYASATSRNLVVAFADTIADSVGNTLAATTNNVTLKQDTTAPVISGLTYNTDGSGDLSQLVLHLSKGAKADTVGGAIVTSGVKVIDVATGQDVSTDFTLTNAVIADGDKQITFNVTGKAASTVYHGTYKFMFPAGIITDNTQGSGNTNAATTLSVNFGSTVGTFSIAQSQVDAAADGWLNTSGTITVNFGATNPVTSSAINPANYTVAGKVLPSDTLITLDPTETIATITLPAGFVATDDTAALFNVKGVVNQNGVSISPFTGYAEVRDNTAPTLQSAQIVDANHILLTYSENMNQKLSATNVASEFVISNNGTFANAVAADKVVGHENQVMLTLGDGSTPATGLNLKYAVTVKTVALNSGASVVDNSLAGNDQVDGTTVTATN